MLSEDQIKRKAEIASKKEEAAQKKAEFDAKQAQDKEARDKFGDAVVGEALNHEGSTEFLDSPSFVLGAWNSILTVQSPFSPVSGPLRHVSSKAVQRFPYLGSIAVFQKDDLLTHGIVISADKIRGKMEALVFMETHVPATEEIPALVVRKIERQEWDISFLQLAREWSLVGFIFPELP